MKFSVRNILGVSLIAATFVAQAQTARPGLWEITEQMPGESMEQAQAIAALQKEMARMPAPMRRMMEDMMERQGMRPGASAELGSAFKVCVTPEMIARNDLATLNGDCTRANKTRNGNTQQFSFECKKPTRKGEGQVTITSPETYFAKVAVIHTERGAAQKSNLQTSGRWLGKYCGAVKPMGAPMPM